MCVEPGCLEFVQGRMKSNALHVVKHGHRRHGHALPSLRSPFQPAHALLVVPPLRSPFQPAHALLVVCGAWCAEPTLAVQCGLICLRGRLSLGPSRPLRYGDGVQTTVFPCGK